MARRLIYGTKGPVSEAYQMARPALLGTVPLVSPFTTAQRDVSFTREDLVYTRTLGLPLA